MDGFRTALGKYAQFTGRSRRREYWGFTLTVWLIGILLTVLYVISLTMFSEGSTNWLALLVIIAGVVLGLALVVPTLAVGWRRCQDAGIPGAVALIGLFIPLVIYIIALIPGTEGPNAYGPDPKA